jgi:hypothetical protein
MWQPDSPAMPAGDHDGLAVVTPQCDTIQPEAHNERT